MLITDILLDGIGQLELLDTLGSDLAAVNGARASFGTHKTTLTETDIKLLRRLGDDIHHTPLRHVYFQFRIKAPEFVARQWAKHMVGCEFAFKDLPWSEFSKRYKAVPPEFYIPKQVRCQSKGGNKQASDDNANLQYCESYFKEVYKIAHDNYQTLLSQGVAREQARLVLPLATYTEWTWTASIQALVHFCVLRDEPGAQWEIQRYAEALRMAAYHYASYTWDALELNHPLILRKELDSVNKNNLSKQYQERRAVL